MSESSLPPGAVVIPPSKIYEIALETRDEVKRLTTLVDPALQALRADVENHDVRIDRLERFRWLLLGAAVGSGIGAAQLVSLLGGG